MKVHSIYPCLLWLLVPSLVLIYCIEITKALASSSPKITIQNFHKCTTNLDQQQFSKGRRKAFFSRSKNQHSQQSHVASTTPLCSSATPSSDWRISSTSTAKKRLSKTEIDSTVSSEATSTLSKNKTIGLWQSLTYRLEVTRTRLMSTYTDISPIIRKINKIKPQSKRRQTVQLVDIEWLKTHEEVLRDRVDNLRESIKNWEAYRLPLLVDGKSGAILDGHHRYHVGRQLGLSRLPVILVDYLEDDSIDVDVWPECGIDCISKEDVIQMSLSDSVFPPKTSRHDFVTKMAPIDVPLSMLV